MVMHWCIRECSWWEMITVRFDHDYWKACHTWFPIFGEATKDTICSNMSYSSIRLYLMYKLFQWNFFFYKFILFLFYFCLLWVFVAARGLSLVAASRGYSWLQCAGFSLWWLLLWRSTDSRAQAQWLWCAGLVAPRHVGSSRTRARTCVPCIGRQIF